MWLLSGCMTAMPHMLTWSPCLPAPGPEVSQPAANERTPGDAARTHCGMGWLWTMTTSKRQIQPLSWSNHASKGAWQSHFHITIDLALPSPPSTGTVCQLCGKASEGRKGIMYLSLLGNSMYVLLKSFDK